MKDHLTKYKADLEKSIGDYMERPATERSAEAINSMIECWMHLNEVEAMIVNHHDSYHQEFTSEDAKKWVAGMTNSDGTVGEHWSIDQTTSVAEANGVEFTHISKWCWWVTMNMMYSDYCYVADRYGVGTPDFYADMSKAFLFDEDGPTPREKLSAYYFNIVCAAK